MDDRLIDISLLNVLANQLIPDELLGGKKRQKEHEAFRHYVWSFFTCTKHWPVHMDQTLVQSQSSTSPLCVEKRTFHK